MPARAQFPIPPANEYKPAQDEFDLFGNAVVELLKTRGATNFAANFAVKSEDWQSVIATNVSKNEVDRINAFAKGASHNQQRLKAEADAVLSRANSLHLDFSGDKLTYRLVPPRHVGNIYLGNPRTTKLTLPYVDKLDILLYRGEATNQSDSFKMTLRGLEKFPSGWRINGSGSSIQWTGFPTNVADPQTMRELAISEKIAAFQPVTGEDDPSLLKLGEQLVRFIRETDTNAFKKDLLLNSDLIWAMYQKSGQKGPTRKELDEEMDQQIQEQMATAEKLLTLMRIAGIDLKTADIQITSASVDHCQSQGSSGSLDQLMGETYKLSLSVKTDARAKNGTPLAGDYVLAVKDIMKLKGEWRVEQDIHWEKLPAGVVDAETAASIAFENHVAQYRALPTGMAAPEIEFTALTDEKKTKLSDFRGKIVVLDFWATWCGPCQEPMAELQKIREAHPDWQDKVAIIPVSIDDTADIVRKHVNERGWTNTINVWAGEGGWRSAAAQSFRVTAVPTSYVIDRQGKIRWAGHPEADSIAQTVDLQLKK